MAEQRENRRPQTDHDDDRLVPPYDDRSKQASESPSAEALRGTVERQLEQTDSGNPGATASPAHESPVREDEVSRARGGSGPQSATDTGATTPMGVGESVGRRGEDVARRDGGEAGRHDTGPRGATQRPSGTSSARDATGVDPQDPDEGPEMPTGDQGG